MNAEDELPDAEGPPEHSASGCEDSGNEDSGNEDSGHDDSGVDLARSIARGLAGRTPATKARSRSGGPVLPRRTGPARSSGAHPDERDPQPLEATVERLVQGAGWSFDLQVHGVFVRWGAIVGAEVADHCRPESLIEGRLVVRTDSTAWATQLSLLASTLVRRLNEELGDGSVEFIDIHGPRGPSWRKGRLRVKGRGPRDTYG